MSKKFKSQDYFRYPRLGTKWRRPKGRQSKLRKRKGGSGMMVSIGHGTPGKEGAILVRSLKDLDGAKGEIIIARSVGAKKAIAIAEKARQLNLAVLSAKKLKRAEKRIKEIAKKKEKTKEKSEKKEEEKKMAKVAKEEKKEGAKGKADEKLKHTETMSVEMKKVEKEEPKTEATAEEKEEVTSE